jgi:hypothetical protein
VSRSRARGAIIIDTDVFSADLVPGSRLAERYAPLIAGRPAFISFQTAAELRYAKRTPTAELLETARGLSTDRGRRSPESGEV